MKFKRVFLIVLDSLGVGEAIDADHYHDQGANTLGHIKEKYDLFVPNLQKLGFLNTLNMDENPDVEAYYTIGRPSNVGKDTLSGHYEMMGIESKIPFKTFNDKGFPSDLIDTIEQITGRRVIGNKYSETDEIIQELGERQLNYGSLIIYTSSDSNLQVAAHEDVIPVAQLYQYCEKIREVTKREEWQVGRIIARPFTGKPGKFRKLNNERRDYAIKPPHHSVLDALKENNLSVIAIGKINDVFDGEGITKIIKAPSNIEAINKLTDIMDKNFTGLCFANLNEFDSNYGHRRDIEGYAKAIEELDVEIPIMLNKLDTEDLLIITADHGNDPTFPGNDHTRENVPILIYSRSFLEPKRLPVRNSLADIGATIAENFEVNQPLIGTGFLNELK